MNDASSLTSLTSIHTASRPVSHAAPSTSPHRATATTSIIIVNYNGTAYIQPCLQSVLADLRPDDELIVVDNASTDGSAELVARTFPQIRLICSEVNLGFAGGCNLGAACASGRYLAFLNPDTQVSSGWLAALIAPLEADRQVGLTTARILLLDDPERINTAGASVHYTGLTLCRGMHMHRDTLQRQEEVGAVSGAAFVIWRHLFVKLGGFDETFFTYMEDTDLSWRARLAGYRCVYVPDSIVYHDYVLRFGPHKTFYQERNRYLMLLKSLHWRTLAMLLPSLLLAEGVTWGFVLLREPRRLGNKLRAYRWVLQHWNDIMQHRRQTRSYRAITDEALLATCSYRLDFEQTGRGWVARTAHALFDPLFLVVQRRVLRSLV